MMMKVVRRTVRWMKVMKAAVRTESMSIKTLKADKEDDVTVDDESDS